MAHSGGKTPRVGRLSLPKRGGGGILNFYNFFKIKPQGVSRHDTPFYF
jgi:hypothetical protein